MASQTRRAGFAAAMWGFARMLGLLPLAAEAWWCETSALTGCRGHPRHFVPEKAKGEVDKFKALSVSHRFSGWSVYASSADVSGNSLREVWLWTRQQDHARLESIRSTKGWSSGLWPLAIYSKSTTNQSLAAKLLSCKLLHCNYHPHNPNITSSQHRFILTLPLHNISSS